MVKVKCPQCGTEIELDKSSYNELLNDIASEEVDKRVKEQAKALEATYKAQLALEQEKAKNAQEQEIAQLKQKNEALEQQFKADLELEKAKAKAQSDKELAELKGKNAALEEKNKSLDSTYKAQLELEQQKLKTEQEKELAELKRKNTELEEKLKNSDTNTQLKVIEANNKSKEEISQKEQEIAQLKADMELAKMQAEQDKQRLKEQNDFALKAKDEEIEKWKSFRVGDSTKDLGESLEQYCHDAFDEIRSYAYPRAYFEKDNEVDEEGKGDFIFRDFTEDGTEYISIMFEMKNQNDVTKTKHKNEHFFDKLDKNRKSKKCEYAVLVSTLEEDSKLYNSGIVDVSHRYPKMYVIRPQHFLAIIGLLKNMALNNVAYMQQVNK